MDVKAVPVTGGLHGIQVIKSQPFKYMDFLKLMNKEEQQLLLHQEGVHATASISTGTAAREQREITEMPAHQNLNAMSIFKSWHG